MSRGSVLRRVDRRVRDECPPPRTSPRWFDARHHGAETSRAFGDIDHVRLRIRRRSTAGGLGSIPTARTMNCGSDADARVSEMRRRCVRRRGTVSAVRRVLHEGGRRDRFDAVLDAVGGCRCADRHGDRRVVLLLRPFRTTRLNSVILLRDLRGLAVKPLFGACFRTDNRSQT